MTETNFPMYEIMLILQPDLGEEKTNSVLKDMKELIAEAGGKISHEDVWGLRDLAYVIKGKKQGLYIVWNFTADPIKVKEFEKQLNINAAIVRYLIQKAPKYHEVKTFAEYEEVAKTEELKAKAEAQEKAEKFGSRGGRGQRYEKPERLVEKPAEKPVKKEALTKEVKKVKKEEPVSEIAEEEKPVEKPKKKQATTLEDVDAKLKSIIDDPDITL
ncbi:MAG: 30S ribosomal protein S6 [Candidatus Gracilibacteria bacterium]|jgi:small subunit ribosomal protein S6